MIWFKATEEDVKSNYERNKAPGPALYCVKDYPYYTYPHYPKALDLVPFLILLFQIRYLVDLIQLWYISIDSHMLLVQMI